jgi:hypothetical protein
MRHRDLRHHLAGRFERLAPIELQGVGKGLLELGGIGGREAANGGHDARVGREHAANKGAGHKPGPCPRNPTSFCGHSADKFQAHYSGRRNRNGFR